MRPILVSLILGGLSTVGVARANLDPSSGCAQLIRTGTGQQALSVLLPLLEIQVSPGVWLRSYGENLWALFGKDDPLRMTVAAFLSLTPSSPDGDFLYLFSRGDIRGQLGTVGPRTIVSADSIWKLIQSHRSAHARPIRGVVLLGSYLGRTNADGMPASAAVRLSELARVPVLATWENVKLHYYRPAPKPETRLPPNPYLLFTYGDLAEDQPVIRTFHSGDVDRSVELDPAWAMQYQQITTAYSELNRIGRDVWRAATLHRLELERLAREATPPPPATP